MINEYGIIKASAEVLAGFVGMASEVLRQLDCPEFTEPIGRVEFVQTIILANARSAPDLLTHDRVQAIVEVLVSPETSMIEFADVQGLRDRTFIPHADRGAEPAVVEPDPSLMAMQDILLPLRTKIEQNQARKKKPSTVREFYQKCDTSKNLLVDPAEMLPEVATLLGVRKDFFGDAEARMWVADFKDRMATGRAEMNGKEL